MTKTKFFAHETSCIDAGASIGEGTSIWHFCHIFSGARIGKSCKIGQNVVIHATAVLGNNVKVQNNVSIYDGVILEDDVFCGPSCVFTNIKNPRSSVPRNSSEHYLKTLVREGGTIGANATIVCGVTVGRFAFIGAGAVVTRNVSDYEVVLGNPAQHYGWMSEHGEPLKFVKGTATCRVSGDTYTLVDGTVRKT